MVLLLLACAAADMALKGASDPQRGTDAGTNLGDTGAAAEDSALAPTHWVLGGEVTLAGGALRAEDSDLTLAVVDRARGAIACSAAVSVDTSIATTAPDPSLVAWWSALVPADPTCGTVPSTLSLGFGALDADLRARLGPAGLADDADTLLGAYLALPDGVPVAFGVARPPARGGDADTATGPAPSDGTWALTPLYAVPLGR